MENQLVKKPRLEWLDALRGFTMILVVAYHVAEMGFGESWRHSSSMPFLVLFRMPLFFFVSGFLAYKASQVWNIRNFGGLLWKKIKVQTIPTVVFFLLAVALLNKHFLPAFEKSFHSPYKGGYWFTIVLLYMFVVYYIFSYLESKLKWKSWIPITLLFVVSLAFYESCYQPKYFSWALGYKGAKTATYYFMMDSSLGQLLLYFPFFLYGNIVHRYWDKWQRLMDSKWFFPMVVLIVVFATVDALKWHTMRMAWAIVPLTIARFGLLTITFMYFRHYQQYFTKLSPIGASLQYIGRRTLDIYLLHFLFIPDLPGLGSFFNAHSHNFVIDITLSVIVGLIIIGFCIITSNILRISPFFKKWLFGRENSAKAALLLLLAINCTTIQAQDRQQNADSAAVVTNSFWDNWYGQVGVNMNLFFPEGHNMIETFPNGKSMGVNVAVGKWFSPEFGGRFKVNWGNGILSNDHNTWLLPYGEPGENHRKGGYLTFLGDINVNLHNLFGNYLPDRKWNLIVAPRAGAWIDIGSETGAHVLGLAVINTYRLTDKWRLYADVGYHFVSSVNGVPSGTGHGSNGYLDINVGVEMDLSKNNRFHKVSAPVSFDKKAVVLNSFWDNWFVQAGLGMSLINAYGTNFGNVIPNGKTFGINLAMGKWFTPEVAVRGGMNLQNAIIVNHQANYLTPREDSEGDPNKHGFLSVYGDLFFNLHHLFKGYDDSRKWNAIFYPRMGIAWNYSSEYQECPIVGLGTEQTYKINDRTKLFADVAYQVTTGGFLDIKFPTGDGPGLGFNSNGWFDINVGVQYELGKNWWDKPGVKRATKQMPTGHEWQRFIANTGASMVVAYGVKTVLKGIVKEERPDHTDNKSFPSGHTALAFAAARSIDKEFRQDNIWIPIAGYAAATAVGIQRVASDKHHWYDVAAGAAIGFGSAELTWWLSDKLFPQNKNVAIGTSGNTLDVSVAF